MAAETASEPELGYWLPIYKLCRSRRIGAPEGFETSGWAVLHGQKPGESSLWPGQTVSRFPSHADCSCEVRLRMFQLVAAG